MKNKESKKIPELNPKTVDEAFEQAVLEPLAKKAAGETPPSAFETEEQREKRILLKMRENYANYKKCFENAGKLLDEAGFTCAYLEKIKTNPSLLEKDLAVKAVKDEETVHSMQETLHITNDELKKIYEIACDNFEKGHFAGARDLFMLMVTLNPKLSSPWLGLGMTQEKEQSHELAALIFTQAAELNPENPSLYLHTARNLHLCNQTDKAIQVLDTLSELCDSDPSMWQELKKETEKMRLAFKA